jgi:hypothetical protein
MSSIFRMNCTSVTHHDIFPRFSRNPGDGGGRNKATRRPVDGHTLPRFYTLFAFSDLVMRCLLRFGARSLQSK